MPRPRKSLICLDSTPYYHCVSRCVRRAYLCGVDELTGKNYNHRRQVIENRALKLASIFAIDICAFAVMSNHTHLVLHVDKTKACAMCSDEVLRRWHMLHKGTVLTRRYMDKKQRNSLSEPELLSVIASIKVYRQRLYDISWFMRLLNEYIARMANKEDACTGRFWEGRFKSQALLDEGALLACMAYVDLNPIRAGKADTPEHSPHTSVKRRVRAAKNNTQPKKLMPFVNNSTHVRKGLPFDLKDYLLLIDETGRQLRADKPGAIPLDCEPILTRVGLAQAKWSLMVTNIETQFSTCISLAHAERKLVI